MGQYYMPVIKRGYELKRVYSHEFGNGLKLTEHSYVGNNFVNVVANEIEENPAQLYWCGDYAEEKDFKSPEVFKEIYNYAWNERGKTTVEDPNEEFDWRKDWYFVNETKKEYLLMPKKGNDVFSPIPLLTALGNGRGGGDYWNEENKDNVGIWAGDVVCLTQDKPTEEYYTECCVYFGSDDD